MDKGNEGKLSTLIDVTMEYIQPYMELRDDPSLLQVRACARCQSEVCGCAWMTDFQIKSREQHIWFVWGFRKIRHAAVCPCKVPTGTVSHVSFASEGCIWVSYCGSWCC